MKRIQLSKRKKGVSMMLAYALLIVIAIALAVGIYAWLKNLIPNMNKEECPGGVSIIIQEYRCSGGILELSVRNKGLFSFDGYYIKGTNNTNQVADYKLPVVAGGEPGIYNFTSPLGPDSTNLTNFDYSALTELKRIEIEPFRIQEKKEGVKRDVTVLCQNAFLVQNLEGCDMSVVVCGDTVCGLGENCGNCLADCPCGAGEVCTVGGACVTPGGSCGDLSCDAGEDCDSCPADCGCTGGQVCSGGLCTTPTPTCPDGVCGAGENCPADATACSDNICYEPICTNGCGQVAVASGGNDEACVAPNSCDGSGNCVSGTSLPTGYVAYWKFDTSSGGTTPDESANSNDGIIQGASLVYNSARNYGAETNGYVLEVDSSGERIRVPSSTSLNSLDDDVTISMWVYAETPQPSYYHTSPMLFYSSSTDRLDLRFNDQSDHFYLYNDIDNVGTSDHLWNCEVDWGSWMHFVYVFSGTTFRGYKNGVQCDSDIFSAQFGNLNDGFYINIGEGSYSTQRLDGLMDDVMIYNRALSASEVQQIYDAQS